MATALIGVGLWNHEIGIIIISVAVTVFMWAVVLVEKI
jgi:hypothetical protein